MQVGITVTATVIDVRRSMITINRRARWHLIYRYEYPKGRSIEGESGTLSGEAVMDYRPGDRVSVKIDPKRPADNVFLGKA